MINVAVAGARGRMGRATLERIAKEPRMRLVGCINRDDTSEQKTNIKDAMLAAADVVIDFTTPGASVALAERCASRGSPVLVIGSTGFRPDEAARLAAAASRIAIVRSGNFSVGVNLLLGHTAGMARVLPAEVWDIEIVEAHHRSKTDAPSGTALMLGAAAAAGRGGTPSNLERRPGDHLPGGRKPGDIGFAVVRGGGIIGEHSVLFASDDEIITLSHSALNRDMFAHGAIVAANWILERAPGEYDMQDVLGLRSDGTTEA